MAARNRQPHDIMKPLLPPHPEAVSGRGNGQPTRPRPALVPTLPVLQRQSAPQQRTLDLRRR
jgi:hypothetical protein